MTEGEDKPLDYPTMFARVDLVLMTKLDLLTDLTAINTMAIRDAFSRVIPVRAQRRPPAGMADFVRAALVGEMVSA